MKVNDMTVLLLAVFLTTEPNIPCFMIKPFVAAYGQAAVVNWARAKGYTEVQIAETIKRCNSKTKKQ